MSNSLKKGFTLWVILITSGGGMLFIGICKKRLTCTQRLHYIVYTTTSPSHPYPPGQKLHTSEKDRGISTTINGTVEQCQHDNTWRFCKHVRIDNISEGPSSVRRAFVERSSSVCQVFHPRVRAHLQTCFSYTKAFLLQRKTFIWYNEKLQQSALWCHKHRGEGK